MAIAYDSATLGDLLETWMKEATPAMDRAESEQDYGRMLEPMKVLMRRLEELGEGPPELAGPVQELVEALGEAAQDLETSRGWPPESAAVLCYSDALQELSMLVFPNSSRETHDVIVMGDPAGEARLREFFKEHGRPYPGDEEVDEEGEATPPPS